jgi:hypothetical protein
MMQNIYKKTIKILKVVKLFFKGFMFFSKIIQNKPYTTNHNKQ